MRERALDLSTLPNGDISFCTLHVPSTRVRRSMSWTGFGRETWLPRNHELSTIRHIISHWIICAPAGFAPSASPVLSGFSGFSSLTCSDLTGKFEDRQWHRISLVSFRLHVDVVHVVLFVRKPCNSGIEELLISFWIHASIFFATFEPLWNK